MFALARELERHGFLERIFSGFNWEALERERLPRDKVETYPWVRPFLMAPGRLGIDLPRALSDPVHHFSLVTLDRHVRSKLPDCDIFVGHEGVGLWSGALAQHRGAAYVCDRGCSHIGWKEALLEAEYDRVGVKWPGRPGSYARELAEYDVADHIVVPSTFARNSFLSAGIPAHKLSVASYGVDLGTFGPVRRSNHDYFDVLFVGALSVRKGAHDLMAAFDALDLPNKRLTIAGSIHPEIRSVMGRGLRNENVRLMGHVQHRALKYLYGASDVMVLPSIEEGLALVQAEALASGCPVIATTNTGSLDLYTDGVEGFIVPIRSPESIAARLQRLAEDSGLRHAMSVAALRRVGAIGGWTQYGHSIIDIYNRVLQSRDERRRREPWTRHDA